MLGNFDVWDGQYVYFLHIQKSIVGSSSTIIGVVLGSLKLRGKDEQCLAPFPVPLHYERQCAQLLMGDLYQSPSLRLREYHARRDGKSIRLGG